MKAYRGVDNRVRLFRADMNMARMKKTAARSSLPVCICIHCNASIYHFFKDFDAEELIQIVCELIRVDKEWVPYSNTSSLYIRPTLIGTDVG